MITAAACRFTARPPLQLEHTTRPRGNTPLGRAVVAVEGSRSAIRAPIDHDHERIGILERLPGDHFGVWTDVIRPARKVSP